MLAPLAQTPVAWSDPRLRGAWIAIAVAAVIALSFLPRSLINGDEYYYAGQAYTLAQGRLTPEIGDPLPLPEEPADRSFRFPVAWPAVLAIGRVVSLRAMWVVALLAHLLGAAAVARMFVRRGVRSELVAVYLFHPVFWLYSRTLLSDVPAAAALVIAMDAWENRDRVATTLSLGFAAGARLANVIAVAGFGLAIINDFRKRFVDLLLLGVSAGLFWGAQLLVNHALSGQWVLSTYYAQQGAATFKGDMVLENLALYLGGLALLPPFPLIAAAARFRHVDRWAIFAAILVLFYIPYSYHNVSPNIVETFVGGQRFVIPAHAALIVATATIWSRVPLLQRRGVATALGAVVGLAVCLAMTRIEARHAQAVSYLRACNPEVVAYNRHAGRVAGSLDAKRYLVVGDRPETPDPSWGVLVIAPSRQSNQPGFRTAWEGPPPEVAGATCHLVGSYAVYDFRGTCSDAVPTCAKAGT